MTVGGDTFISKILEELGFENLFKNQNRYPEVQLEDLKDADLIFLSSEPFPLKKNILSRSGKSVKIKKL
jgi:ABC-type Fe3+-hydroxamate transport system substrate-binding protein